MTSGNADRNLLAGVLGLQTGLFSEASLIQAMQRWVFKKTKPIEDILLEIGALEPRTHSFLSDLVQQHLSLHGLSATLSLAKLDAVGRLHDTLDQLADDDIDASIERSLQAALKEPGVVELESTDITPSSFSDDERFQVLRPYARGGLGIVSIAEDTQLHREVALKEIMNHLPMTRGVEIDF